MESRDFRYNSPHDKAVRDFGVWPYFATYGSVFLLAYIFDVPALFEIPLTSHFASVSSASSWAFVISYVVFHVLMKPRVLQRYSQPLVKVLTALLGIFLVAFIVFFFSLELPPKAATATGRALRGSPLSAAIMLAAASMTVSMGLFTLAEPLRERIARGL